MFKNLRAKPAPSRFADSRRGAGTERRAISIRRKSKASPTHRQRTSIPSIAWFLEKNHSKLIPSRLFTIPIVGFRIILNISDALAIETAMGMENTTSGMAERNRLLHTKSARAVAKTTLRGTYISVSRIVFCRLIIKSSRAKRDMKF